MREFQLYLLNERKLTAQTVAGRITALRFFFVKVLRRPYRTPMPTCACPLKTGRIPCPQQRSLAEAAS